MPPGVVWFNSGLFISTHFHFPNNNCCWTSLSKEAFSLYSILVLRTTEVYRKLFPHNKVKSHTLFLGIGAFLQKIFNNKFHKDRFKTFLSRFFDWLGYGFLNSNTYLWLENEFVLIPVCMQVSLNNQSGHLYFFIVLILFARLYRDNYWQRCHFRRTLWLEVCGITPIEGRAS